MSTSLSWCQHKSICILSICIGFQIQSYCIALYLANKHQHKHTHCLTLSLSSAHQCDEDTLWKLIDDGPINIWESNKEVNRNEITSSARLRAIIISYDINRRIYKWQRRHDTYLFNTFRSPTKEFKISSSYYVLI